MNFEPGPSCLLSYTTCNDRPTGNWIALDIYVVIMSVHRYYRWELEKERRPKEFTSLIPSSSYLLLLLLYPQTQKYGTVQRNKYSQNKYQVSETYSHNETYGPTVHIYT